MDTSITPSRISIFVFLLCVSGWTKAQPSILVEPTSSIVHINELFHFVCKVVNSTITQCTIDLPKNQRFFSISTTDPNHPRYFGKGLQAGECGARILIVNPSIHVGSFRCTMAIQQNNVTRTVTGVSRLSVIPDNTVPVIRVETEEYREESFLNAECIFRSIRSNISWFLDDELIPENMSTRKGEVYPVPFLPINTNARYLTRKVTWRDHGRKLKCIVRHFNGDHDHSSNDVEIRVLFAPRPMENPNLIQKDLGNEISLFEYIFRANPKPIVQWKINNSAISEMNLEYIDEVTNLLQPGMWQAQLEVKMPGKEIANDISLVARNRIGSQTYSFINVQQTPDDLTDQMTTDKLTDECEGHDVTAVVILSILLCLTIIGFTAAIVILKRKFYQREIELLHRLQEAHRRDQPRISRVPIKPAETVQPPSEEYSYISILQQENRAGQSHESMIYQNVQDVTYANDKTLESQNSNSPAYVNHPQNRAYVNRK